MYVSDLFSLCNRNDYDGLIINIIFDSFIAISGVLFLGRTFSSLALVVSCYIRHMGLQPKFIEPPYLYLRGNFKGKIFI